MKKKTAREKRTSPTPEQALRSMKNRALDRRDIVSFLLRASALVVLLVILFRGVFWIGPVGSNDMQPALQAKDLELVYCFPKELWTNDVVVYSAQGTQRTGRIAAGPGDTVEISGGSLQVNGSPVSQSADAEPTPAYEGDVSYPIELGDNEYFLLGDDRQQAKDSRLFGPVERSDMKGKVITVIRRSGI